MRIKRREGEELKTEYRQLLFFDKVSTKCSKELGSSWQEINYDSISLLLLQEKSYFRNAKELQSSCTEYKYCLQNINNISQC